MSRSKERKPTIRGTFARDSQTLATTEFDESKEARSTSVGRVIGAAELIEIKLISLQYGLLPEAGDKGAVRSFNGKVENIDFNPSTGLVFVFNRWRLEEQLDGKKPFTIDAMFVAIYSGLSGADATSVDEFFQPLVPFSVYPYFRTLVGHIAWMSGTNLPPMPIIRTPSANAQLAELATPRAVAKGALSKRSVPIGRRRRTKASAKS